MNPSLDLLDEIVALAYKAGKEILAIYKKEDPSIQKKADKSPVTEADLLSDQIICAGLKKISTFSQTTPIVTEESITNTEESIKNMSSSGFTWLVDPLDGTRDFIAKTGDFAVCIALVHAGVPVLGIVHCPWHRLTLGAVKGLGAYSYTEDKNFYRRKQINSRPFDINDFVILVSRFHTPKLKDQLQGHFPGCTLKVAGSAYKYCLIATGQADLSLRKSPTSLWDIAAAHCILTEAGGNVIDFAGHPLLYNHGSLTNPPLIAHGALAESHQLISKINKIVS